MTHFYRPVVAGEQCRIVALPGYSKKALSAWQRFVAKADGIFGLDIEASAAEGLGTYDPSIKTRLIQFGHHTEAWVLDPAHPKWRREILRLLTSDARFVAHNAAYDGTRVLFEFGVNLLDEERLVDTLPMAALCWPGKTKRKGLKALSDEFIDAQLGEAEHRLHARFVDLYMAQKPRKTRLLPKAFEHGVSQCRRPRCREVSWEGSACGYCHEHYMARKINTEVHNWAWSNIPLDNDEFLFYAGMDAIYVRRLLDILNAEIKRRKMSPLSRTEQKVRRLMTRTSIRGHRVDREWTVSVLDEVEAEFAEAEDVVESITDLRPRSSYMTKWFAEHGVKTKSLDKDHLPKLIEKYGHGQDRGTPEVADVLDALSTISRLSNLLTNLRVIYRHATEGDGFVHPNINTLQAHTGRMSVTGPAMQTLAKKGDKGEKLRGCFIAREGHTFVGADYDSQEIRIAAALSLDPALLKIVREGLNQHVLTAQNIFPDFVDKEQNPDEYADAKTLDFAQQYGAMPKKIAQTLGCTEAEALVLWQRWRHTYSGLVRWTDRLARKRNVRNPYGRLIPRDPHRDYANGNYMIQSTGRDVLGEALVRLGKAGWAENLWLPVHDEMILEVPEDLAERARVEIGECMTTEVKGIEIPAEGEVVGPRWRGLG